MPHPQKGDKVKIWQHPYTKKKFEGIASLISEANGPYNMESGYHRWWVEFGPCDPVVLRTFAIDDLLE